VHPWDHAGSSAARFGGAPADYLVLHGWFDATKAHLAHISHRMMRHHAEGIGVAEALFGPVVGPAAAPTRALGDQHMAEDTDLGRTPVADDWLREVSQSPRIPDLTVSPPGDGDLARALAARFGGLADDPRWGPLLAWFRAPAAWHDSPRWLAMRHHAAGVFEAEHRLGPVIPGGNSGGGATPTRVAAEHLVRHACGGRIPAASDWMRALRPRRWMQPPQGVRPAPGTDP